MGNLNQYLAFYLTMVQNMRFFIICIILFTDFQLTFGQQLFFEKFSENVYNAGVQNNGFVQDHNGIIYCANTDGVLTFNGIKWGLLNTPNQDYISSLDINKREDIYIGSANELGYFRKDSLGTYIYHSLLSLLPKEEQGIGYVYKTIVVNDDVFFSNNEKIYQYHNGKFNIYKVSNTRIFKLYNQIIVYNGNGFCVFDNGKFVRADFDSEIKKLDIVFITTFKNGNYLLLNKSGSVFVLDKNRKVGAKAFLFKKIPSDFFKADTATTQLNYLSNGIIAVKSGFGLVFIDENGKIIHYISKESIGSSFSSTTNFIDKDSNLWVGNDYNITEIYTNSPLSYTDHFNGLGTENKSIITIGKDKSSYFAGTEIDLYCKNGKSFFPIYNKEHFPINSIYHFDEQTYFVGFTGVIQLINNHPVRITPTMIARSFCKINGMQNVFLIGSEDRGLFLLKKNNSKWVTKLIKGFDEGAFNIQEEDGEFWLSQINKGIIKIKLNDKKDSVISKISYSNLNGLPLNINNRIFRLNNGKIIFTTSKGIYRFNKSKNKFEPDPVFDHEATKSWCIYSLTQTLNGDIYFWGAPSKNLQTAGLLAIQPNGTYKLKKTPFSKISIKTNNIRVDVDAPIFADDNREILLGYKGKIITFKPNQTLQYNKPFETKITEVLAKKKILFKDGSKNQVKEIGYNLNTINIFFRSTFLESSTENKFQYKLEGFENKWSEWNGSSEVVFTNLDDGNYNFLVRSKNVYGEVSKPVNFSFYVKPPWYKTWFAYILYLIIALTILYLGNTINTMRLKLIRVRLKSMVDRQTEELINKNNEILTQKKSLEALNVTKDRLFSIISHDLKGPLAQLKSTFDLIDSGDISFEELQILLPMLNLSIGSTLNLADNLLYWAKNQLEGIQLRPVWFDLKLLIIENYDLFKVRFFDKSIEVINMVNDNILVYADKDMVNLILRNLIGNAIKFTQTGGKIIIGCETINGFIKVFVQDNGTGLTSEEIENIFNFRSLYKNGTEGEKGSGLGLLISQDFIEKNGGTLEIESEHGNGSKFIFTIPFKVN